MSVDEMDSILQQADNLKLCSGGPSVDIYPDVLSDISFKDTINKWRHNLCSLVISTGNSCESCERLFIAFQKQVNYKKFKRKHKSNSQPLQDKKDIVTGSLECLKSEITKDDDT